MPERWLGVVVTGERVTLVDAEIPDDGGKIITIVADNVLKLQNGDRALAYAAIARQIRDYAKENSIKKCVMKASAVPLRGPATLSLLQSAELRGVVCCALADIAPVETTTKSRISKTFGSRKADEYLADNKFWEESVTGADLKSGSREAALVILAARGDD